MSPNKKMQKIQLDKKYISCKAGEFKSMATVTNDTVKRQSDDENMRPWIEEGSVYKLWSRPLCCVLVRFTNLVKKFSKPRYMSDCWQIRCYWLGRQPRFEDSGKRKTVELNSVFWRLLQPQRNKPRITPRYSLGGNTRVGCKWFCDP